VEEALKGFDPKMDRIFPRDDSLEERGGREGGEEGGREEGGAPFPFGTGSEDGILDGVSDVLGAVTGGLWPDEGRVRKRGWNEGGKKGKMRALMVSFALCVHTQETAGRKEVGV